LDWNLVNFAPSSAVRFGGCQRVMGVTINVAALEPTELAYERAYDEHWPDVFRFALAWTNDWAAAEDLAQESYLRLWNQRNRLDWSRPPLPWLLVTTRRLATDRFRSFRRPLSPPPPPESMNDAVHARWLDVAAAMGSLTPIERARSVMTAIEGIPTRRRAHSWAPRPRSGGREPRPNQA
jgi:RNA polymerase sigma factor (sigma-70 family)